MMEGATWGHVAGFAHFLLLTVPLVLIAAQNENKFDGWIWSEPTDDMSKCTPVHSARELKQVEQEHARVRAEGARPPGSLIYAFAQKILEKQMRDFKPMEGAPNRYFVSVLGHDLPDRMLSGLTTEHPGLSILPAPKLKPETDGTQQGTTFSFTRFQPIGPDKVEVRWGYSCGILCAGGYTSTFVRARHGIWTLSKTTMDWVS